MQFWWTKRHLERPNHVTLVTTRNSGSSFLNRVELQNGCLAVAQANLFIPSNLNGECFDPDTGKVDKERLKTNMSQATQIYIDRVNGAPCGKTKIQLFPRRKPECYKFLEKVWNIRRNHMVLHVEVLLQARLSSSFLFQCWTYFTLVS